jgi:small subunit ribosomal protein S13
MPRILGVEIPANKKLPYSLRTLYGIGLTRAQSLVAEAKINPDMRASELTEEQINKLVELITKHGYKVEGDLRRELQTNIKRLQAINCYRGIRHKRGLPVRGQRTRTNARTRKGKRKTVGVTKKAAE